MMQGQYSRKKVCPTQQQVKKAMDKPEEEHHAKLFNYKAN